MHPEGAIHDQAQDFQFQWLGAEIVGAAADGLDRVVTVAVAGDHDDLGVRCVLQDFHDGGEALGGAGGVGRQAQILQHHRRLMAAQQGERGRPVTGHDYVVILEAPAQLSLQADIVLDDQQAALLLTHGAACGLPATTAAPAGSASGNWIVNMLPWPGALSTRIVPPNECTYARA